MSSCSAFCALASPWPGPALHILLHLQSAIVLPHLLPCSQIILRPSVLCPGFFIASSAVHKISGDHGPLLAPTLNRLNGRRSLKFWAPLLKRASSVNLHTHRFCLWNSLAAFAGLGSQEPPPCLLLGQQYLHFGQLLGYDIRLLVGICENIISEFLRISSI